jgi:hypothetical protein
MVASSRGAADDAANRVDALAQVFERDEFAGQGAGHHGGRAGQPDLTRPGPERPGNSINISTTEQAQAAFRSELAKYAALVKKVGLEPQ